MARDIENDLKSGVDDSQAVDGQARFEFGRNWKKFLRLLNPERIAEAEQSLQKLLGAVDLDGTTFLDIGAGSGLFSLAAKRLGANVYSFDADEDCVECVRHLKQRYQPQGEWSIQQASVLDRDFIDGLGCYDAVYAWGVLHHTGRMWQALGNAGIPVAAGGRLVVAIYNDQGWVSKYWRVVKALYNKSNVIKWGLIAAYTPYFVMLRYVVRRLTGKGKLERGMSLWHDMLDWLGGYPFEVATPEEIVAFFVKRDFSLIGIRTCGGRSGCNEFVFRKNLPVVVA